MKLFRIILVPLCVIACILVGCQASPGNEQDISTPAGLYFPKVNTVLGNPKGKVTVVEFFDYRCTYCRSSANIVEYTLKTNSNVRFVFRDFPIFGGISVYAAHVAIAAALQGKFFVVYQGLFNTNKPLSPYVVDRIAEKAGIDPDDLDALTAQPAVAAQLQETRQLGSQLGINSIPIFIVALTPSASQTSNVPAKLVLSPSIQELTQVIKEVANG